MSCRGRRTWTGTCMALAVLLSGLTFAPMARGDTDAEAKQHFRDGIALLKQSDYSAAAAKFEQSVALYPTASALFNLANCYRALERHAEALTTLRRLKTEFEGKLKPAMREAVGRHQTELRGLVAEVVVRVNQTGASVTVDGAEVGQSPLPQSVVVGPGTHTIEVSLQGHASERREVTVQAGATRTESFALAPAGAAVSIQANVAGATVLVDGKKIGTTPLSDPLELASGEHTVRLTLEGYEDSEQKAEVATGQTGELRFELVPLAATEPSASEASSTSATPADRDDQSGMLPESPGLSSWFWVGAAGTVASGITAAVFWGLADSSYGDFQDQSSRYARGEIESDDPDLVEARDDTRRYGNFAIGFGIGAGVFAVGTFAALLLDSSGDDAKTARVKATSRGIALRF